MSLCNRRNDVDCLNQVFYDNDRYITTNLLFVNCSWHPNVSSQTGAICLVSSFFRLRQRLLSLLFVY